jgi:LPS export ABC transporter protein LptC
LHYGEGAETVLSGIKVDFYNDRGDSVRSWLTAREGQIDPETRDLIARDSVVVWTRDGDMLETEELRYDHGLEKVVSDCFVRLTRGQSVLTGIGIESDAQLRRYVIRSQVEGDLHEEDGAPMTGRRTRTPGE